MKKLLKYLSFVGFLIKKIWERIYDHYAVHHILSELRPVNVTIGRDVTINNSTGLKIGANARIGDRCKILLVSFFESCSSNDRSISLGSHTIIGQGVDLIVWDFNHLEIKDYTTLQDGCKILGAVTIERYNTLAPNVFISSGNHYIDAFPHWLLKDQDKQVLSVIEGVKAHVKKVHLEEDCWIGYGVFIARGIYVGRGAVIGANSVVTKDVPPYCIMAGAPAKELKKRLAFNPPSKLLAKIETHRPYFYRGFAQRQEDLRASLEKGIIFSSAKSLVVSQGIEFQKVTITGQQLTDTQGKLVLRINGHPQAPHAILPGSFEIGYNVDESILIKPEEADFSKTLENYHIFEFEFIIGSGQIMMWPFGISKIELTQTGD